MSGRERDLVRVERAGPADRAGIHAVVLARGLNLDGLETCEATTFVVREGDRVVGCAALEVYAGGAVLRSVAVADDAAGRGLGRALVPAAIRLARSLRAPVVYLLTTTAADYFPRFGFERVSRDDVPDDVRSSVQFTSSCPSGAVVMRRVLVEARPAIPSLREALHGALILAPMTKGSNLPYRQLCQELGARVTMSEMAVARRLKQKRRPEYALIRRFPDERLFGVQLAGNKPDEMAWAAALVASRGADLVDVNLGCPIDYFTSKGLGAALAREPKRVRRIVEAMKQAVSIPVTVKIRLGWNDEHRNYREVAQAAIDGGADGIVVHGRTRAARYKTSADWQAIADLAASVPVPVIGNGDVLFRHDVDQAFRETTCTAVMTARGALIKPWLFREMTEGDLDPTGDERLSIYRRWVALAKAHWGADERGIGRIREFLLWHLGFWCRYAPRRADGSYPTMQQRESWTPRTPLEGLLARADADAHAFLADALLGDLAVEPERAPAPAPAADIDDDAVEAG